MYRKKYSLYGLAMLTALMMTGCAATREKFESIKTRFREPVGPAVLVAQYTENPVTVDGILDDPVWIKSAVYNLTLSSADRLALKKKDRSPGADRLKEDGEARLAWDENYLYVGIKFYDSDIVQESDENQQHFYASGDLVEIFIKPENSSWYWEIYGTPNEKKTVFWFPGRGRLGLKSGFEPGMNLDDVLVGAQVKGTLNNWEDVDEYWTAEMAIPVKGLIAHGDAFGPGTGWRILVARYNFSRYLTWKELSMVPQLSVTNYHLIEEFGILDFAK